MFRYLFIAIIFFTSFLFAQTQLSKLCIIGQAEVSPSEIVSVRDAGGRFCSAIKVVSDMKGFTYNSYNGVVRVDDQKNQGMVFISADERVLEIYHTGYEPFKIILSEMGIHLWTPEESGSFVWWVKRISQLFYIPKVRMFI